MCDYSLYELYTKYQSRIVNGEEGIEILLSQISYFFSFPLFIRVYDTYVYWRGKFNNKRKKRGLVRYGNYVAGLRIHALGDRLRPRRFTSHTRRWSSPAFVARIFAQLLANL